MKRVAVIIAAVIAACYALVLADEYVNRDVHQARRVHDGRGTLS